MYVNVFRVPAGSILKIVPQAHVGVAAEEGSPVNSVGKQAHLRIAAVLVVLKMSRLRGRFAIRPNAW